MFHSSLFLSSNSVYMVWLNADPTCEFLLAVFRQCHFFHEPTLEIGCLHLQLISAVGIALENYVQGMKLVSQARCQRIWTAFIFGSFKYQRILCCVLLIWIAKCCSEPLLRVSLVNIPQEFLICRAKRLWNTGICKVVLDVRSVLCGLSITLV